MLKLKYNGKWYRLVEDRSLTNFSCAITDEDGKPCEDLHGVKVCDSGEGPDNDWLIEHGTITGSKFELHGYDLHKLVFFKPDGKRLKTIIEMPPKKRRRK